MFLSNNGYGDNYVPELEPAKNQLTIFDLITEGATNEQ